MSSAFFLGANSKEGFFSLYDELSNPCKVETLYILKGGPGSGKSTLMKKIAADAELVGEHTERIYCSSDPDSLDAIILTHRKVAIADGTAPHVIEPKYPFAVERYIDLGKFISFTGIKSKRDEIIKTQDCYKAHFPKIYRLISTSAMLDNQLLDIALEDSSIIPALHKRAKGIISREIRDKGSGRLTQRRFVSALSPKGYVNLISQNIPEKGRVFVLEDDFGIGHMLLSPILAALEKAEYPVFACLNPIHPKKLEHIIVPELGLAFVTSTKQAPFTGEYYRKLRLNAMLSSDIIKNNKQKIAFYESCSKSLREEAVVCMKKAKSAHDDLEALYRPHIDFDGLTDFSEELSHEILKG